MERLLDLISKEDVALFVGAGLSCSAGLPSGSVLSTEIYKKLPENLRRELCNEQKNLSKISSAYINHNGKESRDKLIRFIQQDFESHYPQDAKRSPIGILPRLSHFKTIISTNYDDLIEKCYDEDCIVVVTNNDIPNAGTRRDKTVLVKVHGDFNNTSNVVLTDEDYNNLYLSGSMDTPIWNLVKNELATKNILFLGYGYNDGNIDAVLSYVEKNVRVRKKAFLISQNIPDYKKNELTTKGITFFEEDILTFLQRLIIRFDSTIIDDFNAGSTSYETLLRYTDHALIPVIEGNKFKSGIPKPNVPISFRFRSDDKSICRQIVDIDHFDPIEAAKIIDYQFTIGNILVPLGEIATITLFRRPNSEYKTSIYFPDTDFEIAEVPTKHYKGENAMRLTYRLLGGELMLEFNRRTAANNQFKFTASDNISVKDEIEFLTLMCHLDDGLTFRLTTDEGFNQTCRAPFKFDQINSDRLQSRLKHFKNLRHIEKYYGIKFKPPMQFTSSDIKNAEVICQNINGNLIDKTNDDICVKFERTSKESGHTLARYGDDRVVFIDNEYTVANLHGQKIELGYRLVELINPEYKSNDYILAQAGNYKAIYQALPPKSLLSRSES